MDGLRTFIRKFLPLNFLDPVLSINSDTSMHLTGDFSNLHEELSRYLSKSISQLERSILVTWVKQHGPEISALLRLNFVSVVDTVLLLDLRGRL